MSCRFRSALLGLVVAFGMPASAHAELLHGQYQWPGKMMFGGRPLGTQVYLVSGGGDVAQYKMGLDFSGRIVDLPKVTLWIGGEFNLGGRDSIALIEPGVFCMVTLEKLLQIPLVPFASGGFSFPIQVFSLPNQDFTMGGFEFKVGGGAYYFLIKNLGVGGEMHFAFGGLWGGSALAVLGGWAGYWDFLAGVRAAF